MSSVARPIPDGHVDLPTIRLGDPAAVWPTVCPNPRCGKGQLHRDDDRVVCLSCSTQAAWVAPGLDPLQRYAQERRRWSRRWSACRDCHRTDRRHSAAGRCSQCANVYYRSRMTPEQRLCSACGLVDASPYHTRCAKCRWQVEKARKERAG